MARDGPRSWAVRRGPGRHGAGGRHAPPARRRAAPDGVFFSVDPGADATLGGMVATGASGTTTRALRHDARERDHLTVVTADGEIVRTRSRARKSSAGYDLTRLFIGSEGTLGLITEVTLRVHPTPEAMPPRPARFPTLDGAVDAVIEALAHAIPVARIELLDDAPDRRRQPPRRPGPRGRADAVPRVPRLARRRSRRRPRTCEALAGGHGALGFLWAADEAERRALWHARHRAYDRLPARCARGPRASPPTRACRSRAWPECIDETKRTSDERA